jgi:hypothetical protein
MGPLHIKTRFNPIHRCRLRGGDTFSRGFLRALTCHAILFPREKWLMVTPVTLRHWLKVYDANLTLFMSGAMVSVRMTLSSRAEGNVRESTPWRRGRSRERRVRSLPFLRRSFLTTPILRVLRATENTTVAFYRGTCVEMSAYCSSVTVSHSRPSPPTLSSTNYTAEGVGKSTIVTSLIKESFVSQVGSNMHTHAKAASLTHPGSTHCPGSYYPSRSYAGKRDNVHRGFRVYVSIPSTLGLFI